MKKYAAPVIGMVLVVIGVIGLLATVPLSSRTSGQAGLGPAGGVDSMFIEQMIPHHDDAIAMSELGSERAEHPELRELADDISRTQTAENEQMREWYEQWFGTPVPEGGRTMMGPMMMGGEADMDALETADPFDKAFIEQMVPHHQMGVMMAQMVASRTRSREMRSFAEDIIDVQNAEIDQMLLWYDEWYGQ